MYNRNRYLKKKLKDCTADEAKELLAKLAFEELLNETRRRCLTAYKAKQAKAPPKEEDKQA